MIDSKARFRFVPGMKPELVVPDLSNTKLKPYIGPGAKRHVIETNVAVNVDPF